MYSRVEHKLAWWIDHRLNVLFRRRNRAETASMLKAVFDHAGIKWLYASPPFVTTFRTLLGVALFLVPVACISAEEVVVRPKPAEGPLDNPLKGWCPTSSPT